MKKECKLIKNKLSDYIDDELMQAEKSMIEDHLKECKICLQELNLLVDATEKVKKLKRISVAERHVKELKARIRNEAVNELLHKSGPNFDQYFNKMPQKVSCYTKLTMDNNLAEEGKAKRSKVSIMKAKILESFSFYFNKRRIIYPILACAGIIAITAVLLTRQNNILLVEPKRVASLTDKQAVKQGEKSIKMSEEKFMVDQKNKITKSAKKIVPEEEASFTSEATKEIATGKKSLQIQAETSPIDVESNGDKPMYELPAVREEKLESEIKKQAKITSKPKSISEEEVYFRKKSITPLATEHEAFSYKSSKKDDKIVPLHKRKLFLTIPNQTSSIENVNILIEAKKGIENKIVNLNLLTELNNEELERSILDVLKQYDWYSFFLDEGIKTNKCILLFKLSEGGQVLKFEFALC